MLILMTVKKISSCISDVGLDEGNRYLQTNQPYVMLTSHRCGKKTRFKHNRPQFSAVANGRPAFLT